MAGIESLLNEVKATKEKKSNGKEKVFYPCSKKVVDDIVSLKRERDNLNTDISKKEYDLELGVRERREADAKRGNYIQTYYLEGSDQTIRVTCSDRFSKIAEEDVEDLKEFCAKHDIEFDTLFTTNESLVTKSSAFTKENLNKMLDSFKKTFGKEGGVDFFKTMFEYINVVSPAKGFDKAQFDLEDDVRNEITTRFTKQAKASVVTK